MPDSPPIAHGAPAPAPKFLRLSAGFVYFYFGFLKFYTDLSPAEMLATQTIMRVWPWQLDAHTALMWLAASEVIIGVALMLNVGLQWVLWIFLAHQIGTFLPLFILPELTFKIAPFAPTIEGQFIIKNLISLAAGLTVMMPAVRGAAAARRAARRNASTAVVTEPPATRPAADPVHLEVLRAER